MLQVHVGYIKHSEDVNIETKIWRIVILHVVLYGCESWPLTLREEQRLRLFENRVLREIFGPERGEVTGTWGRQRNEELYDLYCPPNIWMIK
jgi:hypothetical protein